MWEKIWDLRHVQFRDQASLSSPHCPKYLAVKMKAKKSPLSWNKTGYLLTCVEWSFYYKCVKEVLIISSPHKHAQFSSVQSLSRVQLFATPWIAARQASLSITNSRSSPRLTSIESVMPSSQACTHTHKRNWMNLRKETKVNFIHISKHCLKISRGFFSHLKYSLLKNINNKSLLPKCN